MVTRGKRDQSTDPVISGEIALPPVLVTGKQEYGVEKSVTVGLIQ